MFSPKNMRDRTNGRFNAEEYSIHCEMGGHPRVRAHVLLQEHMTPLQNDPMELFDPSVQWVDLAQHMERMWSHYVVAVASLSPTNVYPERFEQMRIRIDAWRALDLTPSRL